MAYNLLKGKKGIIFGALNEMRCLLPGKWRRNV